MTEIKELKHTLSFKSGPVQDAQHSMVLALAPLPGHSDSLISQTLTADPQPKHLSWVELGDGSRSVEISFAEPVEAWTLVNTLHLKTESERFNNLSPAAQNFPFEYAEDLQASLNSYRSLPNADADLVEVLKGLPNTEIPTWDALQLVCEEVAAYLEPYHLLETTHQEDELSHAKLLVKTLRAIRLAARFATGYEVSSEPQMGTKAQAFLPGVGWTSFDQHGILPYTEFVGLKSGATFEEAQLKELNSAEHLIQIENLTPETLNAGNTQLSAASKSEGMATAATRVDQLLKTAKLKVSSSIQISPNEPPIDANITTWPDLITDLNARLENTKPLESAVTSTSGRLHNLHELSGKNAADTAQRARFLSLTFPSLTRLIGLDRFEGPYLTARDEALQMPVDSDTAVFKTRHDLVEPFQTLPNALIERAILARLSKGINSRFAPKADSMLNDSFRLPSILWEDVRSLCSWLTTVDLQIDANWFHAHFQARYPLQQTLAIPDNDTSTAAIEIRPAYRSGAEKHQFGLLEIKLINDDKDRFDVAVNGWTLPLKRVVGGNLGDKLAAVKTSEVFTSLDLVVYDKWEKETVLKQGLHMSDSSKVSLTEMSDDRRLVAPPPHPDLSYILDLAWAEHWGGNGRRF